MLGCVLGCVLGCLLGCLLGCMVVLYVRLCVRLCVRLSVRLSVRLYGCVVGCRCIRRHSPTSVPVLHGETNCLRTKQGIPAGGVSVFVIYHFKLKNFVCI